MIEPHLQPNMAGLRPSATVAINDRSNELIAEGRDVYKLGLGQSPFPVPEPIVEALRAHAHEKDYLPARGLAALRDSVADHHRRTFGLDCDPADVLVGPGSKELIFLLQLVLDGELVVPSPSWVSYRPQARMLGRDIAVLDTSFASRWTLDPDEFGDLCRTPGRQRLLILNYPSNPTGLRIEADRLAAIADAARAGGAILLADEIYAKTTYSGEHRSAIPLYPEGTIFSGGLSKWCGAGGWRLGVFVFPPELRWLRDALVVAATETFTSVSAPIQHAAVGAFHADPVIDDYLDRSRRVLAALAHWVHERLVAVGALVHESEGGFYSFPDLGPRAGELADRGITTSAQLCARLLDDTGVAVLPGSDFGRPTDELTLRLAFVDFDGATALAAADPDTVLDDAWLTKHCARVIDGIDRLTRWIDTP